MERLPDGLVRVTRGENGWLHVEVGRARKVKQFYLSDAEARQLATELARFVVEGGTPEHHGN